jgi:hypothetical protein
VTVALKAVAVHTVPVYREKDGELRYGLEPEDDHPPVVGWANVHEVEIDGERMFFLAAKQGVT